MPETGNDSPLANSDSRADNSSEVRRQEALFKTGALQNAILTSANFSIIATDEKGIIQLFNVGAKRGFLPVVGCFSRKHTMRNTVNGRDIADQNRKNSS